MPLSPADKLARLTSTEWRYVSLKMAWAYRLAQDGLPPIEEWLALRRDVNLKRRNQKRRKIKEVQATATAERKEYLRLYMRDYRKRHPGNP